MRLNATRALGTPRRRSAMDCAVDAKPVIEQGGTALTGVGCTVFVQRSLNLLIDSHRDPRVNFFDGLAASLSRSVCSRPSTSGWPAFLSF
jgi:hypothetical protein